jgi:hypothetical protein
MSHALHKTIPVQNLIKEINCIFDLPDSITDFCITCHEDNLSATAMAESLKFTPWTKHIAIKYHHFRSRAQTSFNKLGDIKIKYILTKLQLADIFTKPLENDSFFRCCNMLRSWRLILFLLHFQGSVRIHAVQEGFQPGFLNS